jgi:hypothetical protein
MLIKNHHMQKLTLILLSVALFSCNTENVGKEKTKINSDSAGYISQGHSDTTKVQAIFKVGHYQLDSVFKVSKDTFTIQSIDSATGVAKLEKRKFVLYYVPIVVDTLKKQVQWFGYPAEFVQEVHVRPIIGK